MRKPRFWLCCGLGAVGAALCAQTFRERVDVEFVRVEVLASDGKGRPVPNLTAADFTVRVDGRPIKVEHFEEARPTASPLPPLPEGASLSSVSAGNAREPAPVAAAPPTGRYFLAVLVDETSSEQSNRQVALREVFQFLASPLPPGVEALFMRFDGKLHIECPWTSDTERLRRAAAAISQHGFVSRLGQPGQSRDPGQGTTRLELDAMESVGFVRTSLAGLLDALHVFPEKPGRKGLYFVSDGMPFLAPSEVVKDLIATSQTMYNSPLDAPRNQAEADYDRELLLDGLAWDRTKSASLLTDIARLALVRGIEINPVRSTPHDYSTNVRTDRSFSTRATVRGGRSLDLSSQRAPATAPIADLTVGESMEAVAETTGGEAVLSRLVLEDGLKQEVKRGDSAYALSFRDPFAGDHRFHRIEIASVKSGVSLRYRRGYRVLDVRESLIQATVNRLYVPADQNELGVRLEISSLGVQNGRAGAQITIAYPAPPEAGGKAKTASSVQIIGTCAVRDGKLSEPIDLSGKAELVSLGDGPWLVREGRVSLLPGAYRFSFAIRDEETGITSYLTFDRKLP